MFKGHFKTKILIVLMFCLLSCQGKKNNESEIASKLEITLSPDKAQVIPTSLSNEFGFQTCVEGGVPASRVRFPRISLKWAGPERLLPLILQFKLTDSRLKSEYKSTVAPSGSNATISFLFGRRPTSNDKNDYIPGDTANIVYSNNDSTVLVPCFLDFGGLPGLKQKLSGDTTVDIRAQFKIVGVTETTDGVQTPFTKEFEGYITYFNGSLVDD